MRGSDENFVQKKKLFFTEFHEAGTHRYSIDTDIYIQGDTQGPAETSPISMRESTLLMSSVVYSARPAPDWTGTSLV